MASIHYSVLHIPSYTSYTLAIALILWPHTQAFHYKSNKKLEILLIGIILIKSKGGYPTPADILFDI